MSEFNSTFVFKYQAVEKTTRSAEAVVGAFGREARIGLTRVLNSALASVEQPQRGVRSSRDVTDPQALSMVASLNGLLSSLDHPEYRRMGEIDRTQGGDHFAFTFQRMGSVNPQFTLRLSGEDAHQTYTVRKDYSDGAPIYVIGLDDAQTGNYYTLISRYEFDRKGNVIMPTRVSRGV